MATRKCVYMKSWIKKRWNMSCDMENIPTNLKHYLQKLRKVLKKDISLTNKPSATCLVCREEIEQFQLLQNQGVPFDTLVHLVFKKDDEILNELKLGNCLMDLFCRNQKKLYFKYLKILGSKMNLKEAIECVSQIEKSSNVFFEQLLKKIAYPFFLLVFAYFMICFFSDFVLVQMKDYISSNSVLILIQVLKVLFGTSILSILLYLGLYYLFFYKYDARLKCPFSLMKKMISLQFVCMYQALEKTYSSTQEVLETLSLMDFSIVGMVSNEILDQLKKGNTLEECFLVIHVFDASFKKMIQYALNGNRISIFFDLYIKKCRFDLETSIKKLSNGIQLFSYISIGILVVVVYQIMMMPMNMLNQF